MGGVKGSGGTPQQQQMMGTSAGANTKGSGGMPMGQGKGYGGMPQNQYQTGAPPLPGQGLQDMQSRAMQSRAMQEGQRPQFQPPASLPYQGPGQPPPSMDERMAMRDQRQQQMAGRQNMMQQRYDQMQGGINSLTNSNGADFMPGGALAAPLDLPPGNPNPGEATPAAAATPAATPAAPVPPQMSDEMRGRLQSQMGGQRLQGGIAGMGKGSGGRGWGWGRGGRPAMNPRGQMANGGIVTLAGGGLADPLSRGGVSYAPSTPNLPRPAAAVPITAAPAVSWSPKAAAAPAAGGMFPGVAPPAIAAPAAWSGPTTPQAIWQPPEKAAATEAAGLSKKQMQQLTVARMLGIPIKNPQAMYDQMSDRQYIDYKTQGMGKGGGGKGGGGGANRR